MAGKLQYYCNSFLKWIPLQYYSLDTIMQQMRMWILTHSADCARVSKVTHQIAKILYSRHYVLHHCNTSLHATSLKNTLNGQLTPFIATHNISYITQAVFTKECCGTSTNHRKFLNQAKQHRWLAQNLARYLLVTQHTQRQCTYWDPYPNSLPFGGEGKPRNES